MPRVSISRDPFARMDHIRETVPVQDRRPCSYCGNAPGRFRYGTEPDGIAPGRAGFARGAFCCVSCMRSYHGI